jgi:hypothetical protein
MLPFMAGVDGAGTLISFFRSLELQTVSIRSARDQGRAWAYKSSGHRTRISLVCLSTRDRVSILPYVLNPSD